MKRYTIQLIITEGNDEGWEEILANGKTGCDDVIDMVKNQMLDIGIEPEITLVKYEDK